MRRDGVEEWKECKLTEIMDLIGGGTPKTSNPDYWDGDIPWISVKDFNGERRYVGDTEKKITKLGLENSSTKILSKGDIIISARGTVGELAIIPSDMAFNQSCYGLRAKDFVDSCFLYYLLKQSVNILKHNTHGSVFDTITRETFENISVKLPPLPTQQKIAAILSSLDDKIELNNKINTNLEQQARALFKNWFVDFEPFGGKMPEEWKVGKLSEIAEITMGQSPDGKSYNEDGIGTVFYQGRAEFGTRFPTRRLFTTEPKRIAKKLDTLMSVRAPVGDTNIANEYCCIGRGLAAIHSKDNHQSFVHYTVLSLRSQLDVFNGEGTVFGCINRDALNNMEVVIPAKDDLDKFEKIVASLDADIYNRSEENGRLKIIRDTLLPKLMNGEITV